jgi:predicted DNA-binding transcriptional regulator AlpA
MANHQAKQPKRTRSAGTACVWPSGIELRYDVSAPTRWRWEKLGLLPPRDVFIGGKAVGWKPETLDAADRKAA